MQKGDKLWKGGGDTSVDSFPNVSKILHLVQMVLPDEIESYFFLLDSQSIILGVFFIKKNDGGRRQWGLDQVHHVYLFFMGNQRRGP